VSGDESPFVGRRKNRQQNNNNNNKRIWKSNPDLAGREMAESNFINTVTNHPNGVKSVIGVNGANRPTSRSSRVKSEMDLRTPAPNGFATAFGTKTTQSQINGHNRVNGTSIMTSGVRSGENPRLIVRNLYYEVDRTSTIRKFCGAQRQKLRILDNVSFEVKSGEILAIMATNGES
jgi:ABC-type glutathione transport system ATPase component